MLPGIFVIEISVLETNKNKAGASTDSILKASKRRVGESFLVSSPGASTVTPYSSRILKTNFMNPRAIRSAWKIRTILQNHTKILIVSCQR